MVIFSKGKEFASRTRVVDDVRRVGRATGVPPRPDVSGYECGAGLIQIGASGSGRSWITAASDGHHNDGCEDTLFEH